MLRLIFVFLAILLLACCTGKKSNKETSVKLISNEGLKLDYNIEVIVLKTSETSLFDYINKVNVDINNDRIFVLSNFNLLIFNSSGEYLRRLYVGRGPGEVAMIISFAIDFDNQLIYVIDNSIKISVFDYHGVFMFNYDISSFPASDIFVYNSDSIFLLRNYVGGSEKFFIGLFSPKNEEVVNKYISADLSPYPTNTLNTAKNFINSNGKLFLTSPNIMGLFNYQDGDFRQLYAYEIEGKSVPQRISKRFKRVDQCMLQDAAKLKGYAPFILYTYPFNGYYLIGLDDEDQNCYAIKEENGQVFSNGAIPYYFNLPDKNSFMMPRGGQNNKIFFQGIPSEFFDDDDLLETKKIQVAEHIIEVNKGDNPFLVIVE